MGSEKDLSAQLDELELPASLVELDQHYSGDCPTTCPLLVRWYDSVVPIEEARGELLASLDAAGATVREPSVSVDLYTARTDEQILFVVLDTDMISRNTYAPASTDIEIAIHTLKEG